MTEIHVTIDFETYSEAGYRFDDRLGYFVPISKGKTGIAAVGGPKYARDPSTELISLAYWWPHLGSGALKYLWIPGLPMPEQLFEWVRAGGLVEAHNAMFERQIRDHVCSKLGWPEIKPWQWRCSAAKARAWSLPGSLDGATQAIGTAQKKDARGKQLIRLLSVPQKPTKARPELRRRDPELLTEMYSYNIQDVVAEADLSVRCPDLTPTELRVWQLDQEINARGVHIDRASLNACIQVVDEAAARYTDELRGITSGDVQTADELDKIRGWLNRQGVNTPSVDAEHVKKLLAELPAGPARRVLEIRSILSARSVKKLYTMRNQLCSDDRIRDLFVYCGAGRTGRWSGSDVQPQNLTAKGPAVCRCPACGYLQGAAKRCRNCTHLTEPGAWEHEYVNEVLADLAAGHRLDGLNWRWGDAVAAVAGCLRGLFTAAPGYRLVCSDYNSIEAIGAAMLAGCQWRIDVFNDHGKIYEASAAKVTGIPLDEILAHKKRTGQHHPARKKIGKVRELAAPYGGWVGAWKNFGADKFMTDEEIKRDVIAWRDESPEIVEMWGGQWRKHPNRWEFTAEYYGLEGAAILACLNPGKCYAYRMIAYGLDPRDNVLYCLLPSGRRLAYHQPELQQTTCRYSKNPIYRLTYMGHNSDYKKGPVGWLRLDTYGPKLFENINQAVCRDIQAAALLRVNADGYPPVLHVHDEITAEIPEGFGSLRDFEKLMMVREPWFADWPVKASGGWEGRRFRK